jgi:hypothetical protein
VASPWNKPKLIEMGLSERDCRDVEDINALIQFCMSQFKGPRHAAPALFTVLCTILAELYIKGEMNDRGLKDQGPMMRDCVKKLVKAMAKARSK